MRRDARSRKQNGKPELPIHRIPQRGESRGLIGIVVHRRCHGLKPELLENQTDLYPAADFGLTARRFRQRTTTIWLIRSSDQLDAVTMIHRFRPVLVNFSNTEA